MSQAFKILGFPILLLLYLTMWVKVQLFWEGHKKVYSIVLTVFQIYLVNVKTIRTIAQIFVAFPEKLNFN